MGFTETDVRNLFSHPTRARLLPLLTQLSHLLAEQGIESYLVGGVVRDVLLGRETADIDIAISADALEVAQKIAAALGGRYVPLDKVNKVGRVVLFPPESTWGQWQIDFSTFEGQIELDLARRDFTIDAMAIDLIRLGEETGAIQLIDPFRGRNDLCQHLIRAVTETVFTSDAVRLLRAVRLAAELRFSIDRETELLMQRSAHLIPSVAGERVREELLRLLAVVWGGEPFAYLDELGLLMEIFPELAATRGVGQPKEHFWNVFEHTLKTVTAVDFLLRQGDWEFAGGEVLAAAPWSETLAQHFDQPVSDGSTRRSLLKLAALLHDVAKPQSKTIDIEGRMRFLGHALEGAAIVVNRLEKLRFSNKEIKLVESEVRYHMRPGQMYQDELPTRRAIYRYFRDNEEAGIDTLFLNLADHLATRGPHLDLAHWQTHARMVAYMLTQHSQQEIRPPKLVDGYDIINIFRLEPGAKIGETLEAVRAAYASGEITTREEALVFIDELLSNQGKRRDHVVPE
ncbi:MAG: tRNA nucleotidyltransferase [Dehalococcoidales bacterium]|nr:tRNA nucleotidyltransferase [Dehalococcoidales bacterium]